MLSSIFHSGVIGVRRISSRLVRFVVAAVLAVGVSAGVVLSASADEEPPARHKDVHTWEWNNTGRPDSPIGGLRPDLRP